MHFIEPHNSSEFTRTSLLMLMLTAGLLETTFSAVAQTIRVDITSNHSGKSFVPTAALGAGIDRIPTAATDKVFTEPVIKQVLSAGWQPLSYRQNTELFVEAWHWNPRGTWSDSSGKGYFVGDANPTEFIRHSFGYFLPRRGFTRNDGTDRDGYSRMTDGDENTYWKSNPYLTKAFTGEDDSMHPQWVIVDLASHPVNAIRMSWAEPYARHYLLQYWTGEDPIKQATKGAWVVFPGGVVNNGSGGLATIQLAPIPMPVRYIRIWMTESSNTCNSDRSRDSRDCTGYGIREIYLGTASPEESSMISSGTQPTRIRLRTIARPWTLGTNQPTSTISEIRSDLIFSIQAATRAGCPRCCRWRCSMAHRKIPTTKSPISG